MEKNGSKAWWAQRISALALIPLVICFVLFILKTFEYRDLELISTMFTSPYIAIFLALFIGTGIYHGSLGMNEIIEDYIHCSKLKYSLMIANKFLSIITAITGICAVLVLHLSTLNFN